MWPTVSLEFDFYDAVCGVEKLHCNDWLMQCMLLLRDTAVIATFCCIKCARWCHCNWTFSTQCVLVANVMLKTRSDCSVSEAEDNARIRKKYRTDRRYKTFYLTINRYLRTVYVVMSQITLKCLNRCGYTAAEAHLSRLSDRGVVAVLGRVSRPNPFCECAIVGLRTIST